MFILFILVVYSVCVLILAAIKSVFTLSLTFHTPGCSGPSFSRGCSSSLLLLLTLCRLEVIVALHVFLRARVHLRRPCCCTHLPSVCLSAQPVEALNVLCVTFHGQSVCVCVCESNRSTAVHYEAGQKITTTSLIACPAELWPIATTHTYEYTPRYTLRYTLKYT